MKLVDKTENDNYNIDKMNSFTLSRWAALMEGVNVIADKALDRGISLEEIEFKQPAISKYVESTCDTIAKNIEREKKEESKKCQTAPKKR